MIEDSLYSFFKGLLLPFSPRFWADIVAGLHEICGAVCKLLCRITRGEPLRSRQPERTGCCIELPPEIYKRPDPLLYSQYYLMSQGLAVT